MIKKIGVVLFTLFAVEVVGCNWFWNQKTVCDPDAADYVTCSNPPPLPPMASAPEAGVDVLDATDAPDADDSLLMCPADAGTDGG